MTRRLIVDFGVAENRAALMVGGEAMRFWFAPARGDEGLARRPDVGDLFLARIRSVSKPLGAAFADIGDEAEAFLPLDKDMTVHEGAALIVRVRRPPIAAKGALLGADWRKDVADDAEAQAIEREAAVARAPALLGAENASARWLARICAETRADESVANGSEAAGALAALGFQAEIDALAFEKQGAEAALENALERRVDLRSGARLVFDAGEALTAIDVDAAGAAERGGRLNDRVNLAAADALPGELARRGIGGRVVIDFLPPSGASARKALRERLGEGFRGLLRPRLGRLSEDGLFDLTLPRDRLSLLEMASEPVPTDGPAPGRCWTLDWRAKRAMAALERALRVRPSARIRLLAGGALSNYLTGERARWLSRAQERYGARFAVEARTEFKERDFDVAE